MKCVHYAGAAFLTGDRIADALIEYTVALARHKHADRIDTPAVIDDRVGNVSLVVGPASQLLVEAVDDTREDPTDDDLVRDLARRTASLRAREADDR